MESDFRSPRPVPDDFRKPIARVVDVRENTLAGITTMVYSYDADDAPPSFQYEHDQRKRLFVLTGPDGKTERFRDNPVKYGSSGRSARGKQQPQRLGEEWVALHVPQHGERESVCNGTGILAPIELEDAAERHEERPHAGARERGHFVLDWSVGLNKGNHS
jgi:hypothetical protein